MYTESSTPVPKTAETGGSIRSWARIPPLDGLRGLAILLVLIDHFGQSLTRQNLAEHVVKVVTEFGWTGVQLFFVLSGFLITGILLDSRDAENYFSSFYFRRALRIFPIYYFSLLLVFFLLPSLMHGTVSPVVARERIWYFLYAQNWAGVVFDENRQWMVGHYWSLGIEEQFYLAWPWIIYKSSTKRVLQIAVGGSIVSLFLRLGLLSVHVDPLHIYRNTFTRMDALLIGTACACLVRNPSNVEYLRRFAPWMCTASLVLLEMTRETFRPFWFLAPGVEGLGFSVIALSYALMLVGVALTMGTPSIPQRIFCSGFMTVFGKYSYGIYIWHLLVRTMIVNLEMTVFHRELPVLANIPLMIAAALIVSMVSYALVERPFLALKSHFKPRFSAFPTER